MNSTWYSTGLAEDDTIATLEGTAAALIVGDSGLRVRIVTSKTKVLCAYGAHITIRFVEAETCKILCFPHGVCRRIYLMCQNLGISSAHNTYLTSNEHMRTISYALHISRGTSANVCGRPMRSRREEWVDQPINTHKSCNSFTIRHFSSIQQIGGRCAMCEVAAYIQLEGREIA
jgi:hypothetical protein